ncbi:MAG: FAD-dependent oxidoreductase [Lachnospiraceae bacterium]|nr:FAD-dependent oxidoreductase [Lachnospiraceae bacterium]MDD7628635.1 FAD-dependent oxidoreductase [Lachnospiraceae bacterium]MDY4120161.1 FAD-dependent oxidoreductase [Lachnospiraceae bacterium]
MKTDLVIIGGGPAGMAAAVSAYENGTTDILILERDKELGGILNQCIHNGFGLHTFKEELTGPEYAARYISMAYEKKIPYMLHTMVVDVRGGDPCIVTAMNHKKGLFEIEAKAVVLAMGCRERPRGAMNIPGSRPSGIYSAGTAQRFVNIEGRMPGKEVVVLGSGDIGLIMARRMSLQGAKVKMVAEIMPYSGGLKRNIVQCLDDFGIPLKLSHTVTRIHGKDRIEGVTVSKVDENLKPIPGSEEYVSCDTLLLSCGLIPENELSESAGASMDPVTSGPVVNARLQTTAEGVFACGNVLHVHDLVDNVSKEAVEAGANAAAYVKEKNKDWGEAVRPKIPAKTKSVIPEGRDAGRTLICIGCPNGCLVTVDKNPDGSLSITGNTCKKGEEYARNEVTAPKRTVTSIVRVSGGKNPVVSVKTKEEIPKEKIAACMEEINRTVLKAPVSLGQVVIADVADTGVDIVATADA